MCEGGRQYSPCSSPCRRTCRNAALPLDSYCASAACVEGCYCPPDTVESGSFSTCKIVKFCLMYKRWLHTDIFRFACLPIAIIIFFFIHRVLRCIAMYVQQLNTFATSHLSRFCVPDFYVSTHSFDFIY